MKILQIATMSLMLGSIAACGGKTVEERRSEKIREFTQVCQQYGFESDTDAMAQCIQTEIAKAEEARRRAWKAISDAGKALQGPTTTNTSCTQWGNRINCSSY